MGYLELRQERDNLRQRLSEKLQSLGYQDVVVEGFDVFSTKTGYKINLSTRLYFWHSDFGFQLSINEHEKTDDLQKFILVCERVISFAKDKANLCTDYIEALENYLVAEVSSDLKKVYAKTSTYSAYASYRGTYHISLERVNVVSKISNAQNEDAWKDNWDEDLCESDYDDIKKEIVALLKSNRSTLEVLYDKCEFAFGPDWLCISLYINSTRYCLQIKDYQETVFCLDFTYMILAFKKVISWGDIGLLEALQYYPEFHLHKKSRDGLSAIICKWLDIYEVTIWSEDLSSEVIYKEPLISRQKYKDFDNMDGHEFEYFCARVLDANGFEDISVTKGSGDQGVDIIAYNNGIRYGIQCKCYSGDIGNHAVQEALAGKTYYDCDIGVVLTNRHFTKQAIELAKRSRIRLWDRDKLIQMISQMD